MTVTVAVHQAYIGRDAVRHFLFQLPIGITVLWASPPQTFTGLCIHDENGATDSVIIVIPRISIQRIVILCFVIAATKNQHFLCIVTYFNGCQCGFGPALSQFFKTRCAVGTTPDNPFQRGGGAVGNV